MSNGAVKWFNRASGFGLIEPDAGGGDLFVHRASLDESVLATEGERVEFEWRNGGMGREAINVVASAPNMADVIAAGSPADGVGACISR